MISLDDESNGVQIINKLTNNNNNNNNNTNTVCVMFNDTLHARMRKLSDKEASDSWILKQQTWK
jgi:hypothetical protein